MPDKNTESWLTIPPNTIAAQKAAHVRKGIVDGLSENEQRIAAMRNRYAGRIGWLVGNGPSVRYDDLARLQGEVTFCCNRFYLAYEHTPFRPTYLVSTDRQVIEDFGAEMVERHAGEVLLIAEEASEVPEGAVWFRMKSRTPLEFSENVLDFVMPGGGTLVAAIQIGYFLGITRFYLYGVDHNFTFQPRTVDDVWRRATGDGNHFIDDYRDGKPWAPPVYWQVEGAYLSCRLFLESKGGWLRNATRGGKLEVLDRVDFDAVAPSASSGPAGG